MVAVRPTSRAVASFVAGMESADDQARIEAVGDALAAGLPVASLELIRRVAAEIAPQLGGADSEALVYWAGIHQRLQGPEFGTALAEMDVLLAEDSSTAEDWSDSHEAELSLHLLSAALAPRCTRWSGIRRRTRSCSPPTRR